VYANDAAFKDLFMGADKSTVNEIEVFEITDKTVLPANLKKCTTGRLFQEIARNAGGCLFEAATPTGIGP
jgi:hypothetical protein